MYFSRPIRFPRTLVCGTFKKLKFSGRRYFRVPLPILLAASPLACPKLYFAGAYNTVSYAGYIACRLTSSALPFSLWCFFFVRVPACSFLSMSAAFSLSRISSTAASSWVSSQSMPDALFFPYFLLILSLQKGESVSQ